MRLQYSAMQYFEEIVLQAYVIHFIIISGTVFGNCVLRIWRQCRRKEENHAG